MSIYVIDSLYISICDAEEQRLISPVYTAAGFMAA